MKALSFICRVGFLRLGIRPRILVVFVTTVAVQVSFGQDYSCGKKKVLICHKNKNTLCVSINSVQAHLDHGDYMGPCTNNECNVSVNNGEITCIDTAITLVAIPDSYMATFSWSGPNNFSSTDQSPTVRAPGIYIVTSNTDDGCTASDTALVTQNNAAPQGIAEGDNITCINTSASLSGSSNTSGVTYKWTGSGGFISTEQYPSTTRPGEYVLSITNPINGCVFTDTILVLQDSTVPHNVTATVQDKLTCMRTSVTLSGSTCTAGTIYKWSGPGNFSSTEQNPIVTNSGVYLLTVTDTNNGCISSVSVPVEKDTEQPVGISVKASRIITCLDTTVVLTGSSVSDSIVYSWLGPDSTTYTGNPVIVSIPGTYVLKVTKTDNGCSASAVATVVQNRELPDLTASVSDTLSPTVQLVLLSASSTKDGITYHWEGPSGFNSEAQNVETGLAGRYAVTVIDPNNDCKSQKQVTVVEKNN